MKIDLQKYKTLVFDCDGVVLNSNRIKTEAFYHAASTYGHEPAQKLKEYHVQHGGISRYKKFEYFLTEILGEELNQTSLDTLLDRFATEVKKGLLASEVANELELLRESTSHANWSIVSGGDQAELREVFVEKGLADLFDGGIFGSPDIKEVILDRELEQGNILAPALFLGDSKYDYQAAKQSGLDFVFISDWTEVDDWKLWCEVNQISNYASLQMLLS